MTTRSLILAVACTLAAGPLAAQGRINPRLAQAQPAKYTAALCPIKAINSKVEKGISALRKAYDAKTPADKSASLDEARTNLVTAITAEAQASNAAAWYYLARVALLRGDPVEADSGFTKAEELVPSCEIDITQYRQNNWAMLANAGIEFQRKGETDSALALFRDASILFRGLPHVYSNMGVVFANSNREDSAAVYFAKALEIAERDSSLAEDRNAAAVNLGHMHARQGRHVEAIAVYNRYLKWRPDDLETKRSLASSFRSAGMADSAEAVEKAMMEELSKTSLDSLDTHDLVSVGVSAYNAKDYDRAEAVFLKAIQRNPWHREARYDLVSTYFALSEKAKDSANALRKAKSVTEAAKMDSAAVGHYKKLAREAQTLLENDPMNIDAMRLLARAHNGLNQEEQAIAIISKAVVLPFTVEVSGFQIGSNKAALSAEAVGRTPQDATGKAIPTTPVTLVVEFLDLAGKVLDTKEITVPALKDGAKHPINLEGAGDGIVGWRYRTKQT